MSKKRRIKNGSVSSKTTVIQQKDDKKTLVVIAVIVVIVLAYSSINYLTNPSQKSKEFKLDDTYNVNQIGPSIKLDNINTLQNTQNKIGKDANGQYVNQQQQQGLDTQK